MLKGFVSGEEKDIKRIPMKGKNLVHADSDRMGSFIKWQEGKSTFTLNGSASANDSFIFSTMNLKAGTYTLSIHGLKDIGAGKTGFYLSGVDAVRVQTNRTYTITEDTTVTLRLIIIVSDVSYDNEEITVMLNSGATLLPYEPYGYQEGWEVRDNQDRLIWGREDTLEGTDSIPINGYGTPLTSVTIKGNGQQSGTPSLQNILPFDGTGERTGNLWNEDYTGISSTIKYVPIYVGDGQFTLSTSCQRTVAGSALFFLSGNVSSGASTGTNGVWALTDNYGTRDITQTSQNGYVTIAFRELTGVDITEEQTMLNAGDSATPYTPYGFSIPLTAASVTTPLYLGEVSTVRRIKKLVLTGEERWSENTSGTNTFRGMMPLSEANLNFTPGYCSHLVYVASGVSQDKELVGCNNGSVFLRLSRAIADTLSEFKSYLAAQYAAGTPVVIWYVLATEQTGIVNEPLMKIGDYADTLTTDTPIPTTTGATDVTVDTKIPPSELTIKVHAKKIRYGFKIDKSQENSESAVIYTHDAVTMTPAVMDFTNDRFSYGSWENAWFVRDARPCALNTDGTVAYYLDPNDATKKLDGTASDIYYELLSTEPSDWSTQWKQYYTKSGDDYTLNDQAEAPTFATDTYYKLTYNSSFTGNFMVEFPQVWFKRYEDTSYNYIEISNYKLSDDWKCYSHINKDGTLVDRIYLPMFKGVIKDSKLRSLPGQIPQGGTTATAEVNAATALGSRWQIWDHSSVECLNDLLTLMSKSIDSQGRFGQGRSTGYDSTDTVTYGKLQTGTLIKKGKFHGYSTTTKEVKVFGIEGFWANRWDRLQGMLLVDNVWKIKTTPPYNFTGTDFVTLSNASVPTGNGYLSKVQTSEYGSIPASIDGGSSTKYFKDYFYKTATDTRVAIRGGYCNNGGLAGFRCVHVNYAASNSNWNFGASPVYK